MAEHNPIISPLWPYTCIESLLLQGLWIVRRPFESPETRARWAGIHLRDLILRFSHPNTSPIASVLSSLLGSPAYHTKILPLWSEVNINLLCLSIIIDLTGCSCESSVPSFPNINSNLGVSIAAFLSLKHAIPYSCVPTYRSPPI